MPWLVCTVILFFFPTNTHGQVSAEVAPSAYEIRFITHQSIQAANEIRSIVLDHRQVLWMATENGIYMLQDGKSHRYSTTEAFEVIEDAEGRLWVSEPEGLRILTKDRSSWLSPTQLGLPKLTKQRILIERVGKSEIAIYDAPNLYRYQPKTQHWYLQVSVPASALYCHQLKYSSKENAFYLCQGLKIEYKIQDRKVFFLHKYPNKISSSLIIKNDDNSDIGPGVSLIHTPGGAVNYIVFLGDFYVPNVSKIERDSFILVKDKLQDVHEIWRALYQYIEDRPKNLPKIEWKFLLPTAVCIDQEGTWFISTQKGLFVVQKKATQSFKKLIPGYSTRGITQDPQGRLLVSAYNNFFRFNDPQLRLPPQQWPSVIYMWDFLWDKQHWYVAAERDPSLLKMAYQDSVLDKMNLLSQLAETIFFRDKKLPLPFQGLEFGRKLIRVQQGFWSFYGQYLIKFDQDGNAKYHHLLAYREAGFVCMLMSKDSSLWLGGAAGLVHVYPREDGRKVRQAPEDIPTSLQEISIKCLYEDHNGYLWIGTQEHGLARLDRRTKQIKWYTQSEGLANNTIYSMHSSHNDTLLWIGTHQGLSCLHLPSGKIVNYHQKDGLAGEEFNTSSVYQAKDGTLFLGGTNGVTYFKPWMPNFSSPPLTPYLSLRVLNRSTQKSRNLHLSPNEKVIIQTREKYLEVGLHANHWSEAPVQYRYRLSGLDQEWQQQSGSKNLIFVNLKPGRYQLWVSARTHQKDWSVAVPFVLHICPAWYQTWWFIAMMGIILAMGIYQLHLFRLSQLRREFHLRKRISDDLHDELSSRLYALRTMAGEIVRSNPERRETLATHFEQLSSDILRSVRDFIWAFDPRYDSLIKFIQRLEDFAENTIAPNVKELEFEDSINEQEKELDSVTRHHVLMIYQELLTNMLKHTQSRRIHIKVYTSNQFLHIRISNEFVQLNPEKSPQMTEGYGQESIQRRLRSIKGKMTWTETPQQQTAEIAIVKQ